MIIFKSSVPLHVKLTLIGEKRQDDYVHIHIAMRYNHTKLFVLFDLMIRICKENSFPFHVFDTAMTLKYN